MMHNALQEEDTRGAGDVQSSVLALAVEQEHLDVGIRPELVRRVRLVDT